ncbi:ATP-binding cassette domain-containing protein [Thalassotalea sp. G20_0]|uniref:ATP-binding cassette ATPase Uup n=1 Tax=Thalassotalea sp. G20_0 TaxID=2821093 RepID=UPI001ADC1F92|nr:ATP-binding cassette domain-containing protein [Thalassotalea sp. G20_0]MBO9496514.1 ATP-binding cassette domain-containing protein [Thalassotalea sp. G20_0]
MPLLRFEKVSLAYGDQPLLDHTEFQIRKGERVCLLGRNGAGKSTLMKLVSGTILPDDGTLWRKPGLKVGVLNQDLPDQDEKKVYDVVASGLEAVGELISRYHTLSMNISTDADMKALEKVQQQLESVDGWSLSQKVDTVIQKLGLPAEKQMKELSGGWRRRVELARALVGDPDLLLLDEPTNHLDIIAIDWLEKQLKDFSGALLFITHDRSFLQSLATRIIELDRGQLTSWECDYKTFLERKAHALEVEAEQNALFDKKLAQEEVWIRQGIKARRTRNEGRVRDLKKLREERRQRREVQGNASFGLEQGEASGKLVLEAKNISQSFDQHTVINDFNLRLMRGDKIGLIGANGAGKSTLLSILLGNLKPETGSVKMGTRLEVAYFDQLRNQLDLEKTVIDNVAEGRESITINGSSRHVIGYLGDFLFPPGRCRVPVKALSGGERNRLLLARLFSKPANLLVMDEPTNDLDVETLELLESLLVEFTGTILLVSHDRTFLDNVVSSTLVFEPGGHISEYVGGFDDWLHQGGSISSLVAEAQVVKKTEKPKAPPGQPEATKPVKKKLSYKLQRELDALPEEIEALEEELGQLEAQTAESSFYQGDQSEVQTVLNRLSELNELIEQKMERWEELDNM